MIIIIGAGLSGITLAQSLLRKNVSFRIFDQSPEEKPQGFGLTLREATTAKILKLLDTDELTFRQAVAVDRNWGSYALSGTNICTGERLSTGAFKASHSKDFRTNRERLRRTIRGDVKVEFGHKLVCFEASAGGVNVEFANGVKLRGGFLIAADGVHSFIRRTVIPTATPQDWPGIFFNGSCRMTIDEFGQTLQPTMGDSAARIGLGDNLVLAVTLYDVNRDAGMVDISWLYSRRKAEGNDPLFAPYAERHDKNCAPPTLWEEIANLPHPLVDPFKRIFARPDISTHPVIHHQLVSLLISREDLSQVLREHQIVFLGDSAHDWTNHAGTAANAAILDAIALGEVIAESKDPEVYYDQRHPTWLTSFENNAQDFETLHRPQQEWDRLFSAQRETGQKLSGEIVTA